MDDRPHWQPFQWAPTSQMAPSNPTPYQPDAPTPTGGGAWNPASMSYNPAQRINPRPQTGLGGSQLRGSMQSMSPMQQRLQSRVQTSRMSPNMPTNGMTVGPRPDHNGVSVGQFHGPNAYEAAGGPGMGPPSMAQMQAEMQRRGVGQQLGPQNAALSGYMIGGNGPGGQ